MMQLQLFEQLFLNVTNWKKEYAPVESDILLIGIFPI